MKKLILAAALLFNTTLWAGAPQFTDLTSTEIEGVMTDFASNFVPTNVSGASSLGKLFGFRLGLWGGVTDTPAVSAITAGEVDQLPVLGLYARIGVPLGFSFDYSTLPIELADFTYRFNSIGVQWTFTDLLDWPLEMQLRANYTTAKLEWTVEDALTSSTVTYDHSSFNMALVFSKNFLMIEPYVGIGRVSGSNDLTAVGTLTVFDASVSATETQGVDTKDTYYLAGIDVNLLFLQVGVEYAKNFDNKRLSARLSFGF